MQNSIPQQALYKVSQQAKQVTRELAKQTAREGVGEATRAILQQSAQAGGQGVLKVIPILGLITTLPFAVYDFYKGRYNEGALQLAAGAASCIPVIGTASSIALNLAVIALKVKNTRNNANDQQNVQINNVQVNAIEQDNASNNNFVIVNDIDIEEIEVHRPWQLLSETNIENHRKGFSILCLYNKRLNLVTEIIREHFKEYNYKTDMRNHNIQFMDVQVGTTGIFVGKCSKDGGKLEL